MSAAEHSERRPAIVGGDAPGAVGAAEFFVLTSGAPPVFSLAPAFAATLAIAVAVALIQRLAGLEGSHAPGVSLGG